MGFFVPAKKMDHSGRARKQNIILISHSQKKNASEKLDQAELETGRIQDLVLIPKHVYMQGSNFPGIYNLFLVIKDQFFTCCI